MLYSNSKVMQLVIANLPTAGRRSEACLLTKAGNPLVVRVFQEEITSPEYSDS